MPLLGKRPETFREKGQRSRLQGELSRPGPKDLSFDPDPIAQVELPIELESSIADDVTADVDLEPGTAVGDIQKSRLALVALREHVRAWTRTRFRLLRAISELWLTQDKPGSGRTSR